MHRRLILAAALAASAAASPLLAAPGGPIDTLALGDYICETGGDALAETGVHRPERDFRVTRGSSYRVGDAHGIYLFTGDRVTFTSGPFEGRMLRRLRENFLRETDAGGKDTDLRCVRRAGSEFRS